MIDLYGTDDSFDELDRPPSKFGTEQSESKASVPCQSGEKRGKVMWDAHLKMKFIGKWWKICCICNLAKILRLETQLYSGGTGRGEN
jgi:hypothetical protein